MHFKHIVGSVGKIEHRNKRHHKQKQCKRRKQHLLFRAGGIGCPVRPVDIAPHAFHLSAVIKRRRTLGNKYAHKYHYGVVQELCGHGVGRELHEDPDVLNYGKYNTGMKLKTGMVIAVEPMITAGSRHINILDDDWTIVTRDGKNSAHFEHTVAVTDDGYEILTGE